MAAICTEAIAAQARANFAGLARDRIPHAATWLRGERWNDEVHTNGTDAVTDKVAMSRGAALGWLSKQEGSK
jgi:hypothetical protein